MAGFQKKYEWHFRKHAQGRVEENLYLFLRDELHE